MATTLDPEQQVSEANSKCAATTHPARPPAVSNAAGSELKPAEPEQTNLKKASPQPSPTPPPLTSPWAQVVKSAAKSVAAQPAQAASQAKAVQQQKRAPPVGRNHARDGLSNGQAVGGHSYVSHSHGSRPHASHSTSGSAIHGSEMRSITSSWRSGGHTSSRASAGGNAQAHGPSKQQQQQQQSTADKPAYKQQPHEQVQGQIEASQQQPQANHIQQQQKQSEKPAAPTSSDASVEGSDQMPSPSAKQLSPIDQQLPEQGSSSEAHAPAGETASKAAPSELRTTSASPPQPEGVAQNAPAPSTPDAHDEAQAKLSSDASDASTPVSMPAAAPAPPPKPAWKTPAQMSAMESPMGGGKAWPTLGDTRDTQKKARSLPASPAKPAPLRPEGKESRRAPPPPPAPVDEISLPPPPPPPMPVTTQDMPSSSSMVDAEGHDAGQAGHGRSLAISIPSTPPPADSAASSPASINTTLSAPAGSGNSRASASFRAAGSKYNQQRSGPGGRWQKGGPRGGTLPNSPAGPSSRGLAMANGFGPGMPGMQIPGRGPGKGPGGRGRGRNASQRQEPNAPPAFSAESWQQNQAAAAAAFYQTQGFYPQMAYPASGYGMPAAPTQLAQAVRHQIEYYLSLDNLVRDLFLRAKMDSDGWIPLAIIAGFNRVRVMTSDVALIAAALLNSLVAELSPDALMVRPKDNPGQWVLAPEQRDPSAAALVQQMRIQRQQQQQQLQMRMSQPHDGRSRNSNLTNGRLQQEGKTMRSTAVQPVMAEPSGELSDEDIAKLFVIAAPGLADASRQPNNSCAAWDVVGVLPQVCEQLEPADNTSEASTSSPAEAVGGFYTRNSTKNGMSGGSGRSPAVAWLLADRPAAARPIETEDGQSSSDAEASTADISGRPVLYSLLRAKCTSRPSSLSGKHIASLYFFWSCFLRDHFNAGVLEDFRATAWLQAGAGHLEGLNSLFSFYSYGLEKSFRSSVYQSFEQDALKDKAEGRLGGLEKLWGFHRYHGLPDSAGIVVDAQVQELLAGPYRSLESFRNAPSGKENISKEAGLATSQTTTSDASADQKPEAPEAL
ncbi:hypothetical protein WJX74_003841 [Apatococcus lobatus]|uniref:HTH La-type RNA-binding domain-containing protein n=1 Tax=Apatococcus lobatus TaxID=904363 RepID=A0AAW1Q8M5_9CHLO